ncbi:hypothetical protein THRCLA_10644 [Thraustotheca clavata]|uniref:Uncharacterized protein n=1 Tax=Thraustotheca clavata TaxID=74557 RepID=A0A1V9YJ39_9STRA|nr:hypothetical protein THRCLA_10644 [Thraustotheca clavata]
MQSHPSFIEQLQLLINDQLEEAITNAIDKQPTDQLLSSDVKVAVVGGAIGFVSALLRPPPPLPRSEEDIYEVKAAITALRDATMESAHSWINKNRQVRLVNWLRLTPYSGDASTCDHIVLTIDGFMSHGRDPKINWGPFCLPNVASFVVEWEAGNANDFVNFASRVFNLDPLATQITKNPWNSAQNKAHQVGIVLADLILSQPTLFRNRKVTVLGHSLGGAIISSLLDHMAEQNQLRPESERVYLHQAIMFGAAFVPKHDFTDVAMYVFPDTTPGRIINTFSTRDFVVKHVFRLGSVHVWPAAAGCSAINSEWVQNVEVTEIIQVNPLTLFGHLYESYMEEIFALFLDAGILLFASC